MPSPEFFQVLPVADALKLLDSHWRPTPTREFIATSDALDRISATEIRSPEAVPAFRKSTVDGYAVRAADTFGASQALPAFLEVVGEIKMGELPPRDIGSGQALAIHTGGMLPQGADAAVMIETTQVIGAGEIEAMRAAAPGENVIQAGEDVACGALIASRHQRLRAADIGGLLAVGVQQIEVLRGPRVGILSCGDELLPPELKPPPGKVRDINAYTLSALAQSLGAEPLRLGIARDTLEDYRARAGAGFAESDILLLSAGSSVSARDYTRDVINGLGAPGLLQHGLATKPGKPTIIAVCEGKPVIGLPGNPVSALLVARQILPHLIARFLSQTLEQPPMIRARLALRVASETGREDWLAVRLRAGVDDYPLAEPIFGKSNLIFTLASADALLRVPLNSGGLDAGSLVDVVPL
ncbi:MAG: molybdopterin molybdotransferase MoeA [Chloroflexota bacterium]|nr:molybdopterin molybdotransferase MoeA [Chloroflexota bacterium]